MCCPQYNFWAACSTGPRQFGKRLVLKGMLFHKVNAQCYDYDMYNMLYICLFLYRFKNWGFKSFIRETKGPSSTSASWWRCPSFRAMKFQLRSSLWKNTSHHQPSASLQDTLKISGFSPLHSRPKTGVFMAILQGLTTTLKVLLFWKLNGKLYRTLNV